MTTTNVTSDEYRCRRCSEVLVLRGSAESDGVLCVAEAEHELACLGQPPAVGDLVEWDEQPSERERTLATRGLVLLGGDRDDYNLRVMQGGRPDLVAGSDRRVGRGRVRLVYRNVLGVLIFLVRELGEQGTPAELLLVDGRGQVREPDCLVRAWDAAELSARSDRLGLLALAAEVAALAREVAVGDPTRTSLSILVVRPGRAVVRYELAGAVGPRPGSSTPGSERAAEPVCGTSPRTVDYYHDARTREVARPPDARRRAIVVRSGRSLAPREVRVVERRCRVDPELAALSIRAVATLADGGACRPRSLRVDGREVRLAESEASSGWLLAAGESTPALLAPGSEVCLSLEVENKEFRSSDFCGVVLLGAWSEPVSDLVFPYCTEGGPCRAPASGGACQGCGYPRAYAHPSSLLDAFLVDQIYVQGTAVQVYPDPGISPGVARVVQRDGRQVEYPVPRSSDAPAEPAGACLAAEAEVDRRLVRAAPRQLWVGADSPAESLGALARARLLEYAGALLRDEAIGSRGPGSADRSGREFRRELALALADGVVALSHGYHGCLSCQSYRVLERVLGGGRPLSEQESEAAECVRAEVRTILAEVGHRGRARRVQSVMTEHRVVADDRRLAPRPWVSHGYTGPIQAPLSRIRIALAPGEADHVRVYDVRISGPGDEVGCSVLDRIPGYGPAAVREGPPVDLGEGLGAASRYLPGTALAGQLREGADLDCPYTFPPDALSGGVEVDLGRTFPPLSQVSLTYQVEPGHLLLAVVEPA